MRYILSIVIVAIATGGLYFTFELLVRERLRAESHQIHESKIALLKERKQLELRKTQFSKSSNTTNFDGIIFKRTDDQNPSLNLQTIVGDIAKTTSVELQLLGPWEENESESFTQVSIEFEAETDYSKFLEFVKLIEQSKPALFIKSMQLRPIQSYNDEASDVTIFARLIIAGNFE